MPYTMFLYDGDDEDVPKVGELFVVIEIAANVLDAKTGERGTFVALRLVEETGNERDDRSDYD